MRWVGPTVVCGLLAGCSSAAYEKDYARRLQDYRAAAEFAPLRTDASVIAGRAELRVPVVLTTQLDGSEDSKRATPPFLREFPGFATAFEKVVDVPEGRLPIVLTIGVCPTEERRKEDVAEAILKQVRRDEEFGKAAWQKGREVSDAAGAARKWDVLEAVGPQLFQLERAGVVAEKRLPGRTEIWMSADPGQKATVVLAWRVPDAAAATLPLPAIAPLMARTVRAVEP